RIPGFATAGVADRACQEAKHRVRSGITSAELKWPSTRITVNLAPAELRKEGSGFDLPIALALLAASRQVPPEALGGHAAVGELGLDGTLRPVGGVLAAAGGARESGMAPPQPAGTTCSSRGRRAPARRCWRDVCRESCRGCRRRRRSRSRASTRWPGCSRQAGRS